jgi:hypothetical protein
MGHGLGGFREPDTLASSANRFWELFDVLRRIARATLRQRAVLSSESGPQDLFQLAMFPKIACQTSPEA